MASQQATYVQISRAREETKLYVVSGEKSIERRPQLSGEAVQQPQEHARPLEPTSLERKETIDEMTKSWSRDAAKGTSLDYAHENTREQQAAEKSQEQAQGRQQDNGMEMEL